MTPEPRRSFLSRSAAGIAGLASLGSTDGSLFAGQETGQSQPVPENAESITVEPKLQVPLTQIGTTEDWVVHRFRALTVEDETKHELTRFLEAASHDVQIEGRSISEPAKYWSDITQTDSGTRVSQWEFITPPRPAGTYDFSFAVTYDSPITTRNRDGDPETWEGEYEHEGRYVIIGDDPETDAVTADDFRFDCGFGSLSKDSAEQRE